MTTLFTPSKKNQAKKTRQIQQLLLSVIVLVMMFFVPVNAYANPKFATISIDAHNGNILHARNADARRYPASLTKVMTLYILFQEMRAGNIKPGTKFIVSKRASRQEPSKLWLKPGSTISAENAIRALVTKSANDVATTVAEGISGTETAFAARMTKTAKSLGMTRTVFANASGLPNRRQITTARDMATLGLRIQKDFPEYYGYFKTRKFTYKGRTYRNHNKLLGKYNGTNGIKTGYTRASGFNLISSVNKGNKRVIAVVMGGKTGRSRNAYMISLLDRTFGKASRRKSTAIANVAGKPPSLKKKPLAEFQIRHRYAGLAKTAKIVGAGKSYKKDTKVAVKKPVKPGDNWAINKATQAKITSIPALLEATEVKTDTKKPVIAGTDFSRGSTWQIQIGAYASEHDANTYLSRARKKTPTRLSGKQALAIKVDTDRGALYRARFAGFSRKTASRACRDLKRRSIRCITIAPHS